MVIRKEYNIGQLVEQLQTEIENSKKYNRVVKLDILTANDILDVLNETNKREQKHQTLESACNFMEMEEGTQTNEFECHSNIENVIKEENNDWNTARKQMELHSKIDSNGNILRGVSVEALRQTKIKERNETLCSDCLMSCCCHVDCKNEHITKQMLGDLVKCFGKSYGKNAIVVCETCKYKEQCREIKNNDLEDNRKCFGACVKDDYLCTHCADYEKCLEETIRELEEEDDML